MAQQPDPFANPELEAGIYGGFIPTPPDPRDFRLPHLALRGAQSRTNHDLRQWAGQSQMTPIRNQGQIGSCTGQAWARMRSAAAARYHIDREERPDLGDDISAQFIYDVERNMTGHYPNDSGANMRDGGDVLNKYGVPPERYYPYTGKANNGPLDQAISPEVYQAALQYGVTTFYRLDDGRSDPTDLILGCLDEGWCCVIAILVPSSFGNVGSHGRIPMPGPSEQVLGGHALTVCGNYIDTSFAGGGCYVVANSWGEGWGDGGYCYLPFAYFTTSSGRYGNWGQEAWTVR